MSKKPGARDFRDMRRNGEKPRDDRASQDSPQRWWTSKEADIADSVIGTVGLLEGAQAERVKQLVVNARLYGNSAVVGGAARARERLVRSSSGGSSGRISFNAIGSIVDTLVSRIGSERPRPYYLTSGGSYRQQRRAKLANRFTEGVFYETKTYGIGRRCARDSFVWGDGLMGVFPRAKKLVHERVLGNELWVDELEAAMGQPRNMYRLKTVDRDVLAAEFGDDKEAVRAIEGATRITDSRARSGDTSNMVRVIESWHRAAEDQHGELVGGAHSIVLDGGADGSSAVLVRDGWDYDFFPFAKLPWCERAVGYWSQGICEQLQADQIELNKELYFIQRSLHLASTVKVFLKAGSKVVKEHISNEVGAIIEHTGDAPVFFVPQPAHPMLFENVNSIIDRMYRRPGASELSATGKKPAGLNSGRALREFDDINSDRHKSYSMQLEDFYLEVARLDAAFAGELGGYSVRVPGRGSFDRVDFRDIGKFDEDDFVRQCFPVSSLPRDPAGRLQTIQEYIQAGFLTPRQGRRALDFPDLDTIESLANAQEDLLSKVLDDILDKGTYRPPEPTDDLSLAKEMVLESIQRYRQYDDAEYEKLDMLRRWNSQVDTLVKRAMAPPPQLTALPGGAQGAPQPQTPQGAPPRAPASDLMPQRAA